MNRKRFLPSAMRAALRLMVLILVLGPLCLGTALAGMAPPSASSCPCDDERLAGGGDAARGCSSLDEGDHHRDVAPASSDDCPRGCPDCRCCGARVSVLAPRELALPSVCRVSAGPPLPALADALPNEGTSDIFRPPRSLV